MVGKVLQEAEKKGYEGLLKESTEEWKKYWEKSDITIESKNDFDQLAVRFALYHLNIMVKHDDNRVGIGAKALTGEGYDGHSFWDTEMFILPYFTFTQPETARTLLGISLPEPLRSTSESERKWLCSKLCIPGNVPGS